MPRKVVHENSVEFYRERAEAPKAFARRVRTLRQAVTRELATRALRDVARETGMSPTGLSKFSGGAEPYVPTVGKLWNWYLLHAHRKGSAPRQIQPDEETALEAFRTLAPGLPPETHERVFLHLADQLRAAYAADGISVPDWLAPEQQPAGQEGGGSSSHTAISTTRSSGKLMSGG